MLLRKNQATLEFMFPSEEIKDKWVSHLRGICIMTDFDEKYAKLKMIKNDSSVKVRLIILKKKFTCLEIFDSR